jgi:hypothetical protein
MTDSERDRLDDLIAKLEAASEGSRELDEAIGEALLNGRERNPKPYGAWADLQPEYSTSLDAGLPDERIVQVHGMQRGKVTAHALLPGEHFTTVAAEGATEPLARRAAALKARREGGDHE